MTGAIEIRKLTKRYDDRIALCDLDLEVNRGDIFGFLGHNGAGKTTTINILTTLLKPTSGNAAICGVDVVADGLQARARFGFLPENVRLYSGLTAIDNLRFLARLSGLRSPDIRIQEVLRFLDCEGLQDRSVGTMSKGQRQRIGLAQAILHRPDVLFLDEPASGLDPIGIKTLRDLIVRLNRELGTTIFMNTHLISEVSKTCTSIGVLSHGRLVFRDTLSAVLARIDDEEALEQLYMSVSPQREA
jgi:ABC-2 type transport system ATP-binding protein